jgi:hypothetical protein
MPPVEMCEVVEDAYHKPKLPIWSRMGRPIVGGLSGQIYLN